jgi:hypothetical protein
VEEEGKVSEDWIRRRRGREWGRWDFRRGRREGGGEEVSRRVMGAGMVVMRIWGCWLAR